MGSPVSANRLMVVVGGCLTGVVVLVALSLPVASDLDVLRAIAILLAGLLRLLGRLCLLDRGGLRLGGGSAEGEHQPESGQRSKRCRAFHGVSLPHRTAY